MAQLSQAELANWIALYVAAGLCCALAMALSVGRLMWQLYAERVWADVRSLRTGFLFLPRIWWRWQKLYLTSTPVTLAIVGSFGATLSW